MALGGGTFTSQNKVLPGAYINFVSAANASATLSDRGYATMPVELNWGATGVVTVTAQEFIKNSMKLFGYSIDADELRGLRELFSHAQTVHLYRLNGDGEKASCDFGTAKYTGTRGNDIKIVIAANLDTVVGTTVVPKYDVSTLVGTTVVDKQIAVESAEDLVDNDFVVFDKTATLAVTAGTALTGGTNSTVTGTNHQAYLDAIEGYSFNVMGTVASTDVLKRTYANFVRRLREEVGKKFQVVLSNYAADYEGVINVKNTVTGASSPEDLVYWVTGYEASLAINRTATNHVYDGELTVNTDYTQAQLEAAISAGEFVLHRVDDKVRVLLDINSLVTLTDDKGKVFQDNQAIRIIDQIATDVAVLFNTRYNGMTPNDNAGRISLWNEITKLYSEMQDIRAIQNFVSDDVTVEPGDEKGAVVVNSSIEVIGYMSKLYMTVVVG